MEGIKISSVNNPRVKLWSQLHKANKRDQFEGFLTEGYLECSRGLESGFEVMELLYCPAILQDDKLLSLLSGMKNGVPVYELDLKVYSKIAYRKDTEGLMAVFRKPALSLADLYLQEGKTPLFIILENIEKPGNLGAVLRTADAVNACGVILTGMKGTDQFNPNVVRASIGTVFSVPVVQADDKDIRQWLSHHGIQCMAAALPSYSDLYSLPLNQPTAFVFGNEHEGLSTFWLENADLIFTLPMLGKADSLNISVSAAVASFEFLRQFSLRSV